MTPTLFDVEPDNGRTRDRDPETSRTAARRSPARTQRRVIASALLSRPYVTADWLADQDHLHQSHRSVWSSRLGGLVKDGYLCKGDPVPGPTQHVLSYSLTSEGKQWALDLTREAAA